MTKYTGSNIDELLYQIVQGSESELDLKALLEKKLAEYDLSKTKVVNLLGIDKDMFDDIISGTAKQPTLINIIKVAQFLEIDIKDVIPAVLKNQSSENIGSIEKAKKATFIAKHFDIKKLSKAGFFQDSDDTDYLVNRVLQFFGYSSVFEYESQLSTPLFSKTKRATFTDKMKDFWIKSAYQCFKDINNPNRYDRNELKELVPKIKPYCQDVENGLLTVCKALYNIGVTVIFQNQLATTQLRGGTFIVNNKPCIVLTDLNKRYTTIWETLIHELYHALFDFDTIASMTYHISGEPDLQLIEPKAENFSREYFCGLDDYKYIAPHIKNDLIVSRFAQKLEVHKSFIYSSFRFFQDKLNGKNYWAAFTEYFPDYSIAVKGLKPVTWKEQSVSEIAENIRRVFEIKQA